MGAICEQGVGTDRFEQKMTPALTPSFPASSGAIVAYYKYLDFDILPYDITAAIEKRNNFSKDSHEQEKSRNDPWDCGRAQRSARGAWPAGSRTWEFGKWCR
jgi:hypothetical protein